MAKYGSFKFGPYQKYGTGTTPTPAPGLEGISLGQPGDRIFIGDPGNLNGVYSISDKYFYVGINESLSTTYDPANISYANNSLPFERQTDNLSTQESLSSEVLKTDVTLVQAIGNPIIITQAGARFSR